MMIHDSLLKLGKNYRLQWEKSQDKYVLLYAEGMVELNDSAAQILLLCDGTRTPRDIINKLEEQYADAELDDDVNNFLEDALHKGWVQYS